MSLSKYILSIDKGTTNIKAVLFDLNGNDTVGVSRACETLNADRPGWREQDLDATWELTKEVVRSILKKGYSADDIISVGVSGLGNGLLLIDKNGRPVRYGIMSIDTRAKELVKSAIAAGIDETIKRITRFNLYGGSPTILLRWLKENEFESYRRIHWIIFSKDWINYKLTGNVSTDLTDASGAGLVDVGKGEYARDIFDYLKIGECEDKLPEIIPTWEICGHVTENAAAETGLKKGTPVISGAHDMAACAWGAGGLNEGHLTIIVGTCGLNLIVLNEIKETANAFLNHVVPERWLAVNGDNNSGSTLDWFINALCESEKRQANQKGISVYSIIEEKIKNTTSSNIIYHPFLYGSIDNASALSGFYGVGAWHTKENILKAVYEGIAFSHCLCIDKLKELTEIKSAWLVGGGAKSNIWGQMFADITGIPLKIPAIEEITSRGIALSAGIGAGIYKNHDAANLPLTTRAEYTPDDKNREKYLDRYQIYKKAMVNMREIWDAMHKIAET
jgi:L-xylulokinase